MPQLRRSLRAAAALLLVAFALSGCVRFDLDLKVNSDETVDGTLLLAVKKSLLTLGGGSAEAAFDLAVEDGLTGIPAATSIEPYEQDGYYGKKIIYDDVPFAEFDKAAASDRGPRFRHEGGRIIFTMTMDLAAMNPGGAPGLVGSVLRDKTRWAYFVLGGCCLAMFLVVAAVAVWLIRRRGTGSAVPGR
jgi:hypothetical protein